MSLGPFQLLILALVFVLLFGGGRISDTLGDFGKGVKAFRKGLGDSDTAPVPLPIEGPAQNAAISPAPPNPADN